ncbi:hypothetical protein jaqu_18480 [Jannaschia aquimarina]|uniref:Uncharacterized protein n=1 Tax=Jannaschia aquimarina TaxID=935700 RepID=A0A0D1EHU6_9RHOB|nr:hypothetical protein jaqu_18480 [Jannaschia aquimarina]
MPLPLLHGEETEKLHQVFADQKLRPEAGRLSWCGQRGERPVRAMHDVAHAVHVKQDVIRALVIQPAGQTPDHRPTPIAAASRPVSRD